MKYYNIVPLIPAFFSARFKSDPSILAQNIVHFQYVIKKPQTFNPVWYSLCSIPKPAGNTPGKM